ncbi:MarR family transcriptional regulator [Haloferax sp. ATB1]|uniref:helix-turn-helix transcriptional regulator n=1 Tax=Haloferax sp. ATB1 TaxID=1508454 RepID=UPI0005B1F14A|nr:MarR family transcriptional regulator [Haloferax sp. ATB1]
MNRRQTDTVVGIALVSLLAVGGLLSWQAYQQQQSFDQMMGSMMGTSMTGVHGTSPLWYVLGTLVVTGALGGIYFSLRDSLVEPSSESQSTGEGPVPENVEETSSEDTEPQSPAEGDNPSPRREPILDVLPEDERRILEPVLSSPGITQIELRDRSDFSKSKVSQTVSELEKRGLLYRERQGRTYRVYPSDDLLQRPT